MFRISTHLWISFALLIISSVSVGLFLNSQEPNTAGLQHFLVLYCLIFVSAFSFTGIIGYYIRRLISRKGERFRQLANSRRQGILFGFLTVIFLTLQAASVLNLWTAALAIVALALIELYVQ